MTISKTPEVALEYSHPSSESNIVPLSYIVFLFDIGKYPTLLKEFHKTNDIKVVDKFIESNNDVFDPKTIIAAFSSKNKAREYCETYDMPERGISNYYVTFKKIDNSSRGN